MQKIEPLIQPDARTDRSDLVRKALTPRTTEVQRQITRIPHLHSLHLVGRRFK